MSRSCLDPKNSPAIVLPVFGSEPVQILEVDPYSSHAAHNAPGSSRSYHSKELYSIVNLKLVIISHQNVNKNN